MSAKPVGPDPRLVAWIAVVVYFWQREGVSDQDRVRLRTELERDLAQSLAEGASVDDLVAADPSLFAREVADADGVTLVSAQVDHQITTLALIVSALGGAVVGAVVSWQLIYPLGARLMDGLQLSYTAQRAFAVGLHLTAACLSTAFAMMAVWWQFRFQGIAHRTVAVTGVFLMLGGATSVLPTMALASSLGYSTQTPAVILEFGIVVAFCVAGLRAAAWLLTRGTVDDRAEVRPTAAK